MSSLNNDYWSIKQPNGTLLMGYNSATNGLYTSEGRAKSQLQQRMKRYQKLAPTSQPAQETLNNLSQCQVVKVRIVECV